MANTISATVVNVNGSPNTPAVNDFSVGLIDITGVGTSSSPTANSRIRYYKDDQQWVDYYVTETVPALMNLANTGGVGMVLLTCISLEAHRQVAPIQVAIPARMFQARPAQTNSAGINSVVFFKEKRYGVAETVAGLLASSNA